MRATINREKLTAMLEARRRAYLLLRDTDNRVREARESVNRMRIRIEADANGDQHVRDLLSLPLAQAQAVPDQEITNYVMKEDVFVTWARANGRNPQGERPQLETRISISNWKSYLRDLATLARLEADRERQREAAQEQFGCVDRLTDFVKQQGLWAKDLEIV